MGNHNMQQRAHSPNQTHSSPVVASMGSSNNISSSSNHPSLSDSGSGSVTSINLSDTNSPSASPGGAGAGTSSSGSSASQHQEDLRHKLGAKNVNAKMEKMDLDALLRTDWRHFNCKTWHLEPTVR
jgi:hypothetical protein